MERGKAGGGRWVHRVLKYSMWMDNGKWGGVWELMSVGLDDRLDNMCEGKGAGWCHLLTQGLRGSETATLRRLVGAQKEKSGSGSRGGRWHCQEARNVLEEDHDEFRDCWYWMPGGWRQPGWWHHGSQGKREYFKMVKLPRQVGRWAWEDWLLIYWRGDHWDFSGSTLSVVVKAAVSWRARDWESNYR